MLRPRVLLILSAVVYAGLGLASLVAPDAMARAVGIELATPTARVDFRATYGGFEIGTAIFLLACASRDGWMQPGVWAVLLTLAGFGGARAIGILVGGGADGMMLGALVTEIVGIAWAAAVLFQRQPGLA
ncbi:MAG: hypothetical protein QOD06_3331 [Candidatus Binatota bacterium]|jgi:hypothetical protein|nr:hypothetical protein [Candidatus Binatota bacterium]